MKMSKKKKLEAAGWKVGSAAEFLELSDAEAMLVNMKVALAKQVKVLRKKKKITQQRLAKLIGSSHLGWRSWKRQTGRCRWSY